MRNLKHLRNATRLVLALVGLLAGRAGYAQSWALLPSSPVAGFRHDDLFFVHPDTGWVVNVDGYIYRTTDGGQSFAQQLFQPATSFRCVGFADARRGWAGNLGPGSWSPTTDTIPLYQTSNGGATWQPVTTITGFRPKGICGIDVVTDSVVYAVGRVGGPACILKTTNGGRSWRSVSFNPPAFYLIDCHFASPDTGFVVGATGTTFQDERYAIFSTTDGGQTWQQAAGTRTYNAHCWKIDFPSRRVGYVSIESGVGVDSVPVLKTTDGGLTWHEKLWSVPDWFAQGIGFINDSTGWCGSRANQVKQTTDGGATWQVVPFVPNFNRFRRLNDTLAYASGTRIWKYGRHVTGVAEPAIPAGLVLEQNYPNPFAARTTLRYTLPRRGRAVLRIYDLAGRPVRTLVDAEQGPGAYEVKLALPYIADSPFYCTLTFDRFVLTKRMLMVR